MGQEIQAPQPAHECDTEYEQRWPNAVTPAPAVGAAPDDLVQLVGVKDGVETVLGTATMPPKMKARELVRQYFGPFDHEADGGETDAGMAYVICEELIDWMAKTPQVFNVTAKPPVQGSEP